jgi:hypothetical protein
MAASFPAKTNFVNGDVLFAAEVNQIGENLNDLDTRAKRVVLNAQTGTTYTLALSDAGKLLTLTNAATITLTVPDEATVAFPTGSRVDIVQLGAGQVEIDPASGVTVDAKNGDDKLAGQYSAATLIYLGSDDWIMIGDLDS